MVHEVTVLKGDGVGPEIVDAALRVIDAAGVELNPHFMPAGEAVFNSGISTGLPPETVEDIKETRLVFKGPLGTPSGGEGKSTNVTLRGVLGLSANLRPAVELPEIKTPFSGRNINVTIVRENLEGLYVGESWNPLPNVAEALKITSREGSESIIRFAFETARIEGKRTVHCAHKANIQKNTEELFLDTFRRVSVEYPDIHAKEIIIDNLCHQLVRWPESFDVLVMSNEHGDIVSDLTAGLVGGLGIAPSANIGPDAAMFEAVHGTAPDIAGQNKANPLALILSAVLMLRYLGETEAAAKIQLGVLETLQKREYRTKDIQCDGAEIVGTDRFTDEIIANMPSSLDTFSNLTFPRPKRIEPEALSFTRNGFVLEIAKSGDAKKLFQRIEERAKELGVKMDAITNMGVPYEDVSHVRVPLFRIRFSGEPEKLEQAASVLLAGFGDDSIVTGLNFTTTKK